jgi:uncharacterized protein (TIGR02466 family)
MALKFESIFPTLIARGTLSASERLNREMLKAIRDLSSQDRMGIQWSKENYRGGYTSYASLNDLHHRMPVFARFADMLQPYVENFGKSQGWAMKGLELEMSDCWMNIMPRHTYHNLHLHPHSVVSGVYYVSTPKGSVSLKLEDPRMTLYMNAPQRKKPLCHTIVPTEGSFVLFESWLRHEVPPNQSAKPRISLSFNYRF